MELLFLVIFFIIILGASWITQNIHLIISLIVLFFVILIIRNIREIIENKKEYKYIDTEILAFIFVKIILCVLLCLGTVYLF